ncbi:MAG TPA: hypothetical protein VGY48_33745 [Vicinamibacterales bacterium]|jgi:hypothetical protein|nr:hypothetical protein [Vicinamibacterales bacterium]
MRRNTGVLAALCALAPLMLAPPAIDPEVAAVLTRLLRFSAADLSDLRRGRVVKHALDATAPGEIAVVGGVRVVAPMARLVEGVRRIEDFKRGPDVLQIGRFSDPPSLHDLDALVVTREDFDPRDCRVGDCGIRLPADAIRRLPGELESETDTRGARHPGSASTQERAGRWFKRTLLEHVSAYWSGTGNRMASYDDGSQPIRPIDEFAGILQNERSLAALAPGLPEHLLGFPKDKLPGAEDFLYWSKEKFGIAPFITVTHVTIVCPSAQTCLLTSKDVYSSRYVDASLSMTIASSDTADANAFYLVYVNRSRANALKGRFSGLRRSIAERRARASLEETLKSLKSRLEASR